MGDLPRASADPRSATFLDDETRDGLRGESPTGESDAYASEHRRVTEPP